MGYAVGACAGVGGVKDSTPWRVPGDESCEDPTPRHVPGAKAAGLTRKSRLKPAEVGQNLHLGVEAHRPARARG